MKTEGQVRHKLQQVTYRHLQRAIRTKLSRRPENCSHNRRVKLPVVGQQIRFCAVREDADGDSLVCDESHEGVEQASQCLEFLCENTKDGVKTDFTEFLKGSDVASIAAEYPDIAALLWTLDDTDPISLDVGTGQEPTTPEANPPSLPPYEILYLHPEGGSSSRVSYAFHRAVTYDAVTFTLGKGVQE